MGDHVKRNRVRAHPRVVVSSRVMCCCCEAVTSGVLNLRKKQVAQLMHGLREAKRQGDDGRRAVDSASSGPERAEVSATSFASGTERNSSSLSSVLPPSFTRAASGSMAIGESYVFETVEMDDGEAQLVRPLALDSQHPGAWARRHRP